MRKSDIWIINDQRLEDGYNGITQYFIDTFKNNDLDFEILYNSHFKIDKDKLFYDDTEVCLPKIVFYRVKDEKLEKFFDKSDVILINNAKSRNLCDDKYTLHNLLASCNIKNFKQPKYFLYDNQTYETLKNMLASKFVMKDNFGRMGGNCFLIENKQQFDEALKNKNIQFLCQEYISHSVGTDLRFFVVHNKVAGTMQRINENDWKSNLATGGRSISYEATENQKQLAIEIAQKIGAEIMSVDFLFGENQLYFCEANSAPGVKGFMALDINVVDIICKFFKELLKN